MENYLKMLLIYRMELLDYLIQIVTFAIQNKQQHNDSQKTNQIGINFCI